MWSSTFLVGCVVILSLVVFSFLKGPQAVVAHLVDAEVKPRVQGVIPRNLLPGPRHHAANPG